MFRQHSAVPRSGDGCEVAERVYQVNGHGRHDTAAEEEAGERVSSVTTGKRGLPKLLPK